MTHPDLHGRVFKLGEARYAVARHQPDTWRVRCYRMEGKLVTIVKLPLPFVLQQVADQVTADELA